MIPVSMTAWYCCGVRAADSARAHPVCGDTFARRFMTEEGQAAFRHFTQFSIPNGMNVTRARIFDDWLKARIAGNPQQRVVLVGAGFDTRAYRLGGGRWLELDHPASLAFKNQRLPVAECPHVLQRAGIDFATEKLADVLKPWAGERDVIVVLEGVSEYLTQDQLRETLAALRGAFPGHHLMCELMREDFRQGYTGRFRAKLRELGTDFATLSADPPQTVLSAGYVMEQKQSIALRARELSTIPIPRFLLHTFLRKIRDGYCAYQFRAVG